MPKMDLKEELRSELSNCRSDSMFRRAMRALLSSPEFQPTVNFWFSLTGSLIDNSLSTLEIPDIDMLAVCKLRNMEKEFGLQIEPNPHSPNYVRIKMKDDWKNKRKTLNHIHNELYVSYLRLLLTFCNDIYEHFILQFLSWRFHLEGRKTDHMPRWFTNEGYLSAVNLRKMLEVQIVSFSYMVQAGGLILPYCQYRRLPQAVRHFGAIRLH